jgi:GDP-4-dehydro-6-deoxy-D-mannose reductase
MPKRDYLDVQDCIDAYWRILISGEPGNVYNVCNGSSESIKHILEILIKLSGKEITIQTDKSLIRKNDLLDFYGDNTKLKKVTGWKQTRTIENSLKDMLS